MEKRGRFIRIGVDRNNNFSYHGDIALSKVSTKPGAEQKKLLFSEEKKVDIVFIIKKIVITLVAPLSLSLLAGFFGLFLLSVSKRKSGIFMLFLSLLLTWVFSFDPIANTLLGMIEKSYSPYSKKPLPVQKNGEKTPGPDIYIHVLGGAHAEGERYPAGIQLSPSSLARLTEGIRILNLHSNALLVLSGYEGLGGENSYSNAEASKQVAIGLGVEKSRIILFPGAKDTRGEAFALKDFLAAREDTHGDTIKSEYRIILVTEASHLPRAMMIFRQEGFSPVPAPTYFLSDDTSSTFYPTFEAVQKSERFLYEVVGRVWVMIRGGG